MNNKTAERLYRHAVIKANSTNNEYMLTLIRAMNPYKLTEAELNVLASYVGEETS